MTLLMPRVASRLLGEPLMVDPGKLVSILAGIGGRIVEGGLVLPGGVAPVDHTAFAGGRPSERMGVVGDPFDRAVTAFEQKRGVQVLDRVGSVAIIPIEGTLVQKGAWLGSNSGDTSYEGVRALIARASRGADAGTIKAAVYEVDSYGGEVAGALETAAALAELSRKIPTLAILTDFAFSAGYLMASTARQIVMPPGGGAGSIGVLAIHANYAAQMEQKGIALTFIHAGEHKLDGSAFAPLADDVRAQMQARVDASYERFLAAVGRHRGKRLTAAAARATQARTFSGADAVDAGLVDGIVEVDRAFREFVKHVA